MVLPHSVKVASVDFSLWLYSLKFSRTILSFGKIQIQYSTWLLF
uniref:Uncharacterized protein n=1 Tax=Arundo donax TaxID=35708 RepID=A0A0A8Z463_ARUDO